MMMMKIIINNNNNCSSINNKFNKIIEGVKRNV